MEIRTCEEYVLAKLKELENADSRKDNTIFNLQQIIYSLQRVFRLIPNEDGLVTAQLDFETLNNEKDLRDMLINIFGNPADFNTKPAAEPAQAEEADLLKQEK